MKTTPTIEMLEEKVWTIYLSLKKHGFYIEQNRDQVVEIITRLSADEYEQNMIESYGKDTSERYFPDIYTWHCSILLFLIARDRGMDQAMLWKLSHDPG